MILNLAVKPAYLLIIDTKIQDLLGPEEFGRYFPLLSLSILLNILLDAGLANHMTRLISGNPNEIHQAFQRGWRTKSVLFPAYFVLLMSIGWLLGWRGESLIWLAWIGINQALLSAILYIRAGLQGIGAHRSDAWVSVGDRSMLFLSMGALIFSFERFELTWLLMGTSVALFLTCIIALWRLKKASLVRRPVAVTARGWIGEKHTRRPKIRMALRPPVSIDDDVPSGRWNHARTAGA